MDRARRPCARRNKDPNVRPSSRVKQTKSGRRLHWLFELAIFVKGVDGALETIGGLLILFVPLHSLDTVVRWLVAHELSESHDWLANAGDDLLDSLSLYT